jgi:diguanylate cyclase (GGDEF)-like protein
MSRIRIGPKMALMVLLPLLGMVALWLTLYRSQQNEIEQAQLQQEAVQGGTAARRLTWLLIGEPTLYLGEAEVGRGRADGAQELVRSLLETGLDGAIAQYAEQGAGRGVPSDLRLRLDAEIDDVADQRLRAEQQLLGIDELETSIERRRQLRDDTRAWIASQSIDDPNGSWRLLIVYSLGTETVLDSLVEAFEVLLSGFADADAAERIRSAEEALAALNGLENRLLPDAVSLDAVQLEAGIEGGRSIMRAALELEGQVPPAPASAEDLGEHFAVIGPLYALLSEREELLTADVLAQADTRIAEETAAQQRTLISVAALVVFTGLFATLIGRHTTRRLRMVSDHAAELSAGAVNRGRLDMTGRDEVATLGTTIDDVSSVFQLLVDQNSALAARRFTDPILQKRLPGGMGEALQASIERLTDTSAELLRQATRDDLTGLLDRAGFYQELEELSSGDALDYGAVFFVDLDGFKAVNDNLGHAAGDQVLFDTAVRLRTVSRDGDIIARLGGDEFVLVTPEVTTPQRAAQIATRLSIALDEPYAQSEGLINLGASVGWALIRPERSLSKTIAEADEAMYSAKRSRSGDAAEQDPSMLDQVVNPGSHRPN